MPRAVNPSDAPKACPSCGKTTIKIHRHDITPWSDESPAEPVVWQCVYCGCVFGRTGGSGALVAERHERVVLAPGELNSLGCYQTKRKGKP